MYTFPGNLHRSELNVVFFILSGISDIVVGARDGKSSFSSLHVGYTKKQFFLLFFILSCISDEAMCSMVLLIDASSNRRFFHHMILIAL